MLEHTHAGFEFLGFLGFPSKTSLSTICQLLRVLRNGCSNSCTIYWKLSFSLHLSMQTSPCDALRWVWNQNGLCVECHFAKKACSHDGLNKAHWVHQSKRS